jgi:hypothetical protein
MTIPVGLLREGEKAADGCDGGQGGAKVLPGCCRSRFICIWALGVAVRKSAAGGVFRGLFGAKVPINHVDEAGVADY